MSMCKSKCSHNSRDAMASQIRVPYSNESLSFWVPTEHLAQDNLRDEGSPNLEIAESLLSIVSGIFRSSPPLDFDRWFKYLHLVSQEAGPQGDQGSENRAISLLPSPRWKQRRHQDCISPGHPLT
eukprot:snap_masked-scaffold733_size105121-processed-gene-0.0 protein:Tk04998 transcript:snap_masked-scaffold733_size105121-processed-gene-0.0-mRNA-1 annotation:"quinoprotein alcohol dehydrogenase-like protein"